MPPPDLGFMSKIARRGRAARETGGAAAGLPRVAATAERAPAGSGKDTGGEDEHDEFVDRSQHDQGDRAPDQRGCRDDRREHSDDAASSHRDPTDRPGDQERPERCQKGGDIPHDEHRERYDHDRGGPESDDRRKAARALSHPVDTLRLTRVDSGTA